MRVGTLTESLVTYGTVVAAPGAQQSPSVPFEAIVERVLVAEGMPVAAGQALVVLRPSPSALTQVDQARSALRAAQDQLRAMQERDSLGLSTRDQISQAEQALQDAESRFHEVETWSHSGRITAPAAGVVTAVLATEGALLPPGSPLVNLALQGRFEVRLGAEPEDIDLILAGQPVTLRRLGDPASRLAHGRVRSVAHIVSPDTRLVDVMVTVTGGGPLLFGETVQGEIAVQSKQGLLVPRSALLPQDGAYRLFTLSKGRAVAHNVQIGLETDSLVEVIGGPVAGDSVVVVGNYVLQDSMRVRISADTSREGGRP